MSHVRLIAADRKLPLEDLQEFREHTGMVPNARPVTVGFTSGFRVAPHEYYRCAVDDLGLEMKPFQYELSFEQCRKDLDSLLAYLRENFASGEEAELWSLWVGDGGGKVRRYRGRLSEFDLDTLEMLNEIHYEPDPTMEYDDGLISQLCLTVEI